MFYNSRNYKKNRSIEKEIKKNLNTNIFKVVDTQIMWANSLFDVLVDFVSLSNKNIKMPPTHQNTIRQRSTETSA